MAENYKHLYEQTKKMLTMYQDELIPGFRKKIEELEAKVATDNNVGSKWISVKDRLPEGDKVVMCYKAGRGIRFGTLLDATYADGVQAFMDRDRTFAFGVTHWMPLPQPPKGE